MGSASVPPNVEKGGRNVPRAIRGTTNVAEMIVHRATKLIVELLNNFCLVLYTCQYIFGICFCI